MCVCVLPLLSDHLTADEGHVNTHTHTHSFIHTLVQFRCPQDVCSMAVGRCSATPTLDGWLTGWLTGRKEGGREGADVTAAACLSPRLRQLLPAVGRRGCEFGSRRCSPDSHVCLNLIKGQMFPGFFILAQGQ